MEARKDLHFCFINYRLPLLRPGLPPREGLPPDGLAGPFDGPPLFGLTALSFPFGLGLFPSGFGPLLGFGWLGWTFGLGFGAGGAGL